MCPLFCSLLINTTKVRETLFFCWKKFDFLQKFKTPHTAGQKFPPLLRRGSAQVESRAEAPPPALPAYAQQDVTGIVKNRLIKPRFRRRNDALGLLELGVAHTDLAVDDQPHADELGALQSAEAAAV